MGHRSTRIAVGVSLILGMVVLPVTLFTDAGATVNAAPGTARSSSHSTASADPVRGTAVDGLFPFTTVTGKVYMSLTAIGTNTPAGGPVYVEKDSSHSTVQAAYLLAAGIPGFFGTSAYAIGNGTITLDGNSLSFTPADVLTEKFSTSTEFAVDNVWTNVTTIVAPVVDAAPVGLVKFTAAEPTHTATITGEILAVIMNDPTLPTDNTVSFLFGGLDPTGDSFNIGLASPLKLSTPTLALIMSIGDSFGYQGPPGDGQYSTITVDTKLMTSAAGGNDDSICKYNTPQNFATCGNGELITVGGIGDTTTDPATPSATTYDCATPPGPPRCTDELYSLLPFVTTGQTTITVKTTNPSHNDDIFFTGFELNAAAAVVGEGAVLTPITGTSPVGSPYKFTAKVQNTTGVAIPDKAITLTVLSGPDAGKVIPATTNTTGYATFTLTGTTAGIDVVRASFTGTSGKVYSNTAQVTWTTVTPPPPAATTVTTSLSGGGQTGARISVPEGTPVTDTAALSGTKASTATGTVTYSVYSSSSCTTAVYTGSPKAITTPGTLPASTPVTLSTAGTYYWKASYSGNSTNAASSSTCGGETAEVETVTPPPAATAVSTSLSGGGQTGARISVPEGTPVTDTAALSGTNASTATGTVTYSVYSSSSCTTAVYTGSPKAITTPGTLPASTPVTLSTAGTYYWKASYSGNSTNAASSSTCGGETAEVETVTPPPTKEPTSLTTKLSGGGKTGTSITVPVGTPVSDLATLSGTNTSMATGTVTYSVYSNSSCTTAVHTGSPQTITMPGLLPSSATVTLTTPGTYYWQASYSGNTTNEPSTSACGSEVETVTAVTVTPKPTYLRTVLSGSGRYSSRWCYWHGGRIVVFTGTTVTDQAFLSGKNAWEAGGTVTYTVYGLVGVKGHPHRAQWEPVASGGTVTVTDGSVPSSKPVSLGVGVYEWQASYSGDALNDPSKSPLCSETEIVVPAPPTPHCQDWHHDKWCKD